jgi:serine/threonine protein kinase
VLLGPYELRETLRREDDYFVKLAVHTANKTLHEVRVYSLKQLKHDPKLRLRVEREVITLRHITHPYIQRLDDVLYTPSHIYVILEFCQNGDLLDALAQQAADAGTVQSKQGDQGITSPGVVARLFLQLMTAIAYLHSQGLVHRDVKLEHLLLDANNTLKLTGFHAAAAATFHPGGTSAAAAPGAAKGPTDDVWTHDPRQSYSASFGAAKSIKSPTSPLKRGNFNFSVPCGSCHYVSPEVIRCADAHRRWAAADSVESMSASASLPSAPPREYDGRLLDVWSCGVVLFALATGHLPFNGATDAAVFGAILSRAFHESANSLVAKLSPQLIALIDAMLDPNPATRITAGETLQHSYWVAVPAAVRAASRSVSPEQPMPTKAGDHGQASPATQAPTREASSARSGPRNITAGQVRQAAASSKPGGYAEIAATRRGQSAGRDLAQPSVERRVARSTISGEWV